jgi:hypothetical protein
MNCSPVLCADVHVLCAAYELAKIEQKIGSPEKPLSDLGLVSYRSYWASVLVDVLRGLLESGAEASIEDLSRATCMTTADVIDTLQHMRVIKYHKGDHIICLTDAIAREFELKPPPANNPVWVRQCIPEKLHWTPFILKLKTLKGKGFDKDKPDE